MAQVITRFAPSPTGHLHIGGARTALYSYLWAKHNHGKFLLRIEDTDQARYHPEAEASIYEGLRWLGIDWEEPVIKQSTRTHEYRQQAETLVKRGTAYYCFCTPERLELMRQIQRTKGRAPKYDKTCLRLTNAELQHKLDQHESYVIRLNVPDSGTITIDDAVRGRIEFACSELDDQILLKSDGFPTYHLANVVDDHASNITHVIRGEEWIPSTPKHVLLYQACGWTPPVFAHLSLFIKKGGGKLSKREGATGLLEYKSLGYLPQAVVNFIALLGWNPKTSQEIFSLAELIQAFDLQHINHANPIFDTEKLDWFNGQYIRQLPLAELITYCQPYLPAAPIDYISQIVALEQDRLKKFSDITANSTFFFTDQLTYEANLLLWKKTTAANTAHYLQLLLEQLQQLTTWQATNLEHTIITWIQQHQLHNGDILWPWRVALTGVKASPPPFAVAAILGKDRTLARVQQAINLLSSYYEMDHTS
ncbi:MAG: glutamate--tRNA ligase [Candidatus Kerfeldbacteria bacterium]|nr:glutamate--tRNA ligase [Candidatus Kerfeldbacteria bacterium]